MVDKPTAPTLDPMKDSEEQERVKLAAARAERDGDGTWTMRSGHVRTDVSPLPKDKKQPDPKKNYDHRSTSYSNLFGQSGLSDKPLWSDSTTGRIAIRLISRGIFGALAFTWGQRVARNQLQNYTPDNWDTSKPLQWVAKGIDSTVGRAIQKGAEIAANASIKDSDPFKAQKVREWVHDSTQFRYKAYFHDMPGKEAGRSLGAEVVGVTFDFAMASIADATLRNVIQAFDPNNLRPWIVDAEGNPTRKGRFDFGKWGQAVGRATWRILSKNQGEDWAAALPYVYQMKWQRQWIANKWPGAKNFLDNGMNGAGLMLDTEGNITGDYNAAGAIDLQARFVGYNWYTLMYRESYDAIASNFTKWKENGFKLEMPKIGNPITGLVEVAGSAARYVMKSFIKANIYMQPAVPFFWVFRVPQSKWRGGAIVSEGLDNHTNAWASDRSQEAMHESLARRAGTTVGAILPSLYQRKDHDTRIGFQTNEFKYEMGGPDLFIGGNRMEGTQLQGLKSMYDDAANPTAFSRLLNWPGKLSYNTGTAAVELSKKLPQGIQDFLSVPTSITMSKEVAQKNFVRNFVDASFSYTPYMIAKAETALRVDERPNNNELGEMDKAIYRLLDSTFTFNLKGIGRSIGDIAYLSTHTRANPKSREGDKVVLPELPPTALHAPHTTVNTQTVQRQDAKHDAAMLERANDNEHAANDNGDRGWAESVTGQKLAGRFHDAQSITH